jgi:hypothetical protein
MVHTGARRVDMDNSSESPGKASKHSHNSNSGCGRSGISRSNQLDSCYPEIPVGELVSPKSTLKHVFGTGKGNQVSLKGEVLVQGYRLDGSRMQKELHGCKNFCG